MKFGQDFQAALARDEYPQQWIDSAISYKKLKKCIKRVQQELTSLGLDKETLDQLWQHIGSNASDNGRAQEGTMLHYSAEGSGNLVFTPRLTIAIDPNDGSPMDAWLSPDTRRILRRLARNSRASSTANISRHTSANGLSADDDSPDRGQNESDVQSASGTERDGSTDSPRNDYTETIEIPLTSDSEFFQILRRELADLDHLQQVEKDRLQVEISKLGHELRDLKAEKSKKSKQEIEAWRKIFELYSDSEVFLSSHEADAGARDSAHAQQHFQDFSKLLATQRSEVLKLGKTAGGALDRFLKINVNLLRLISFQEINRTALTKIMKKFDKRTSLHAQSTIQSSLTATPFLAQNLARATYFTISEEILNIIPQLNDYLCPICFSISWKPVRLQCNHVFCIRCLIVLQRRGKAQCPLCREEVVLEANTDNIDQDLVKFLKANFKSVVKQKQKDNELAAGIDRWGEQYEKSQKCLVM